MTTPPTAATAAMTATRQPPDELTFADLARMERADRVSPAGGVIRGARRPEGWTPPGRVPPTPDDLGALWPRASEDLCWLAGHWRILQRIDGHRFSLDDLVTAEMAARVLADSRASSAARGSASGPGAREAPALLDLGCGIGTVLLFLAWRFPLARITGIEAQALSAGLARRSIAWNGVSDRCRVIVGDLRDPRLLSSEGERFDLIAGTPPYFAEAAGVQSPQVQRGPCRFEHRGGLEDYCRTASQHLGPGAPFVACASALQRARLCQAAAAAGLAIERLRDVVPRAGKPPLLVTFSMRQREWAAARIDEPPLVVRDGDGQWTDDFRAVRRSMGMP